MEIGDNKLGKLEHTGVGGEAAVETRGMFGSKAWSKEIRGRNRRGGLHNGRSWGKS